MSRQSPILRWGCSCKFSWHLLCHLYLVYPDWETPSLDCWGGWLIGRVSHFTIGNELVMFDAHWTRGSILCVSTSMTDCPAFWTVYFIFCTIMKRVVIYIITCILRIKHVNGCMLMLRYTLCCYMVVRMCVSWFVMPPAPYRRGIKRWCCLTSVLSDVCTSGIGPKLRTERPRKTKIGTEVAHITGDSDTTFKVNRSKVKVTRPIYSPRC